MTETTIQAVSTAASISPRRRHAVLRRSFFGALLGTTALVGVVLEPGPALAQTWDGDTDINWGDATNWDTNAVPGVGNTVTISGAGGANQPTLNVASASLAQTNITAGTLTVDNTLTSTTVTVSGTGNLIVNAGDSIVGNLSFAGTSGTNSGTLTGNLAVSSGTFTNEGSVTGTTTVTGGILDLDAGSDLADAVAVTVNGGTLNVNTAETIGSLAGTGGAVALAATLTAGGDNTSTVYTGVISGTDGLTKEGTGTFTVTGANTYTGATTINAGTLVAGNATSLGTVAAGTTVAAGATLTIASVAIGAEALTLNGGTALRATGTASLAGAVTLATATSTVAVAAAGDALTLSGAIGDGGGGFGITKAGAGTLTLSGANTYTGATTINAGTLVAANASGLGTVAAGTTVAAGANLTIANVAIGAEALTLNGGTALSATGTASLAGAVTLATATSTVTVTAAGDALTLSGAIGDGGGGFGITKAGAGTLTLSGANTYTGATTINAGTLVAANASGLGTVAAGTTVAAGANLTIANVAIGAEALTLNGGTALSATGTASLAGAVTLATATSTVTVTAAGDALTLSGAIGDGGGGFGITKAGAGTLTLSGASTYTGATTVNAGTLAVTGAGSIASTTVTVSGGTLSTDTDALDDTAAVTVSSGTLTATGTDTIDSLGQSGGTITGTAVWTVAGDFTQSGGTTGGTVDINAATFTQSGGAIVASGTAVTSSGAQSLQSGTIAGTLDGAGAVTVTTGTTTLSGTITNAASLTVTSGALTETGTGSIDTAGNTVTIAGGALTVVANGIADDEAVSVTSGTYTIGGADTIASLTGAAGSSVVLNATLTAGDATSTTFAGTASGAGGLTKQGAGTLTLSQANSYTGTTTVNVGTLSVTGSVASADIAIAGTGVFIADGASVLDAADVDTAATGSFQLSGNETIGSLSGTGGTVTLGANTLTVSGSGETTSFAGIIGGTGGLTKSGTDVLTLSSANTYTGATTVSAGTLTITGSVASTDVALSGTGEVLVDGASLLDTADVDIAGTGDFELTGSETIGSLSGASTTGTVTLGANTLTLDGDGETTSFAGIIGGTGGLTKSGTDVLTLSGASTYTGATTVSDGSLIVTGSLASATVTVGDGSANSGLLGGTGSLAGAVTIASGGTLSAGTSPGTLTIVGGLDLASGSSSIFELGTPNVRGGTDNDLVVVDGTLTIASGATISLQNAAVSGLYRLFDATAVAGSFVAADISVSNGTASLYNDTGNTQVNARISLGGQIVQIWDGTDLTGELPGSAGAQGDDGTWNVSNTNWTGDRVSGEVNDLWRGEVGVFAGTAGTVTVAGIQDIEGLQFTVGGYGLTGTGIVNLTDDPNTAGSAAFLSADSGTTLIDTVISSDAGVGLLKRGSGTLQLSEANTYTGATTINAGTLELLGGSAIVDGAVAADGTAGSVVVEATGTLSVTNAETIASLSGVAGSAVTLGATLTTGDAGSDTFAGVVSGAGGLTKQGTGTFTLSGANTFTGAATVDTGTLALTGGAALADTAAVTVNSSGLLSLASGETIGSLAGAGTVSLGASTLTAGGNNGSTTFAGVMSGSGALIKTGTGTFTLTGANGFAGGTRLQAGTLGLGNSAALGSGSLVASSGTTIDYGNGVTIANAVTTSGDVIVSQSSAGGSATQSEAVSTSATSTITKTGAGTLNFTLLNGTFSRLTTAAGGFNVTNVGTVGGSGLALNVTGGTSRFTNSSGGRVAGFFTSAAGTDLDIVNSLGGIVTLDADSTSTFGGADDSFDNQGTFIASGNTRLSGLETFTNSGTINLDSALLAASTGSLVTTDENRDSDDVLTIGGNFVAGTGSTLVVDADFGSAGTSDRLVVTGTGSGAATNVVFNNTNDQNRFGLQSTPIVIATFDGGYTGTAPTTVGSTGARGTSLATLGLGPVDYELSVAGNQWIVNSSLNSDAVGGFAASLAASQSLIAAALSRPSSSFVSAPIQPEANSTGYSPWIRAIGGTVTSSAGSLVVNPNGQEDSSDAKIGLNYAGVQLGFDIGRFNIDDSKWNVNVGVTGGYNGGNASQRGVDNDTDFATTFIGTYVTVSRESFFAEVQARYDYTEFDILAPTFGESELEADSKRFSINASTGYAFEVAEDATVTPTVGLSYANIDTSSIDTEFGTLNFEDTMSLMGYGSVTLSKAILLESGTEALQPFITGTIYNDFGDDVVSSFDDLNGLTANVETDNIGTYGELSIGLNYRGLLDENRFGIEDITGAIRADFAVGDKTEGAGLTGQLRLQF